MARQEYWYNLTIDCTMPDGRQGKRLWTSERATCEREACEKWQARNGNGRTDGWNAYIAEVTRGMPVNVSNACYNRRNGAYADIYGGCENCDGYTADGTPCACECHGMAEKKCNDAYIKYCDSESRLGRNAAWQQFQLWRNANDAFIPFTEWASMPFTRRAWLSHRGEPFTAGYYAMVDALRLSGK